jgi:hypothetical protein
MVLEVLLESLSSQNIRRPDSWPTKHQMRERSLAEACSERFLVCATRLRSQRALLQVARRRQLHYSSGVRFVCVNTRGSAKRNSARAGERTRSRSGIGEAERERERERRAQRRMQSKANAAPDTHTTQLSHEANGLDVLYVACACAVRALARRYVSVAACGVSRCSRAFALLVLRLLARPSLPARACAFASRRENNARLRSGTASPWNATAWALAGFVATRLRSGSRELV